MLGDNTSSTSPSASQRQLGPVDKPIVLATMPSDPKATRAYDRWKRIFNAYISHYQGASEDDKIGALSKALDDDVYYYVSSASTLAEALKQLDELYGKKGSNLYNRYALIKRSQNSNEEVTEFVAALEALAKNCNFKLDNCDEAVVREYVLLGALVNGLYSEEIRTKILEEPNITYSAAVAKAKSMAKASKESRNFKSATTTAAMCPTLGSVSDETVAASAPISAIYP